MFINKVRQQKGSVMPTVIMVLALLIILGIALMETSIAGLKAIKHDGTAEEAYIAAQSAIEESFAYIKNFCAKRENIEGLVCDDKAAYAEAVVNTIIVPKLRDYCYNDKYHISPTKTILKIELSSSHTADVEITDIKYLKYEPVLSNSEKIIVTIGIWAKADYEGEGGKVLNKTVFSREDIEVFIPLKFKLNSAIYSIGDVMVDNIDASVEGDVVAFGTAPEKTNQIEQYYYGGIYAKNKGKLTIKGNAYSRGLIRTGVYSNTDDSSKIYITKDAVANGLHIFGKGQKIIVGRNAYTFDDLEMNGEDSVIAINGSYLGLSNDAAASHHDQSSAIVNSAIIHHPGSDDALKSRIVINGDVIVNGGTFRVEPSGHVPDNMPQIEDASVVSESFNYLPMYKLYMNEPDFGGSTFPTYHQWLYDNKGDAKGFANLMQCWVKQDYTNDAAIQAWVGKIDDARGIGTNNHDKFDSAASGIDTTKISGFCRFEMAANDTVYFMRRARYNSSDSTIDISRIKFLNNNHFELDNVSPPVGEWSSFWDIPTTIVNDEDWRDKAEDFLPGKLTILREMLINLTETFAHREYDYSTSTIKNTLKGDDNVTSSHNLFMDIKQKLLAKYRGDSGNADIDKYIFNFEGEGAGTIDINDRLGGRIESGSTISTDDYFIFINTNPSIKLKVTGKVNGIIFSVGRVELENSAEVSGAILAAGNTSTMDGSPLVDYVLNNKSSADMETDIRGVDSYFLPQVYERGGNLDRLNDGSYAGVLFREPSDDVVGSSAKVVFSGRDILLGAFSGQGIELDSIF